MDDEAVVAPVARIAGEGDAARVRRQEGHDQYRHFAAGSEAQTGAVGLRGGRRGRGPDVEDGGEHGVGADDVEP